MAAAAPLRRAILTHLHVASDALRGNRASERIRKHVPIGRQCAAEPNVPSIDFALDIALISPARVRSVEAIAIGSEKNLMAS